MTDQPIPFTIATSLARDKLSRIIDRVQDPRATCILTRHGKPVAALVSMSELRRIWQQQDIEDIVAGTYRPSYFHFGKGGHATNAEAAAAVQQTQLDRRTEREVLNRAGLEEIPGGELLAEVEVAPVLARRKWWWWWWWW